VEHGDDGSCSEYDLYFTNAGICHLTAIPADSRQVSADVTVRVLYMNTCCGAAFTADSPSLTFNQDASTGSGGSDSNPFGDLRFR
jgi:hypothetical protein